MKAIPSEWLEPGATVPVTPEVVRDLLECVRVAYRCGQEAEREACAKVCEWLLNGPSADEVIASHAKRLALELEGVLLECHDTSATSKWWNSAYQAIHNFHDDVDRMYPQDHVSPLGMD